MILKAGLLTICSSFVLLFPTHGKVVNDPITLKPVKPKVQLAVAESPLKPVEPLNSVIVASQPVYTAPVTPSGCTVWHSGNPTIDAVIKRESGGQTCVTNYLGCYGILQACPGNPLRVACGGDGACQLDWFWRNKVVNDPKYGNWDAVLAHSLAYGWW